MKQGKETAAEWGKVIARYPEILPDIQVNLELTSKVHKQLEIIIKQQRERSEQ